LRVLAGRVRIMRLLRPCATDSKACVHSWRYVQAVCIPAVRVHAAYTQAVYSDRTVCMSKLSRAVRAPADVEGAESQVWYWTESVTASRKRGCLMLVTRELRAMCAIGLREGLKCRLQVSHVCVTSAAPPHVPAPPW